MIESKEDLYSITDAKALSLHLTGGEEIAAEETALPYIQFSSGTPVAPRVPHAEQAATTPAAPSPVAPSEPLNTWEAMLKWGLDVTKSNACFVVDPQGFILMSESKNPPEDGYEGAGANLKLALDQLQLMEMNCGDVQAMELKYPGTGMLVFQAQDTDNDFFTLCFIGATAVTYAQKNVLFEHLQNAILKLT